MTDRETGQQAVTLAAPIDLSGLERLQAAFAADGLSEFTKSIEDLRDRLRNPDTVRVLLCGLFSAGKSSLINTLVGSAVSATGAVPTTAMVHEIEWNTPLGKLTLMDTPGIDSTDAAHQQVTEAALHLADVVCLVVDYAHVESEENLEFARMLSGRGVKLVVVINQIDKHVEFELSFDSFAQRVCSALEDYGIVYDALFYTAVKDASHNQWHDLRDYLTRLSARPEDTVLSSVTSNALAIIRQAVSEQNADERWELEQSVEDAFGELPLDLDEAYEWLEGIQGEVNEVQAELDEGEAGVREAYRVAREGFLRSIDLGQIAPYTTTEHGRKFVESLRQGFKVGFLNTKRQTHEERIRRLEVFQTDLQDQLRKSLIWPLQRELRAFIYDSEWAEDDFAADLDGLDIELQRDLFYETVNQGALESEQYPYQYVKDVVGRVKTMVRSKQNQITEPWLDKMLAIHRTSTADKRSALAERENKQRILKEWIERYRQENERVASYVRVLETSGI